MAPIFGRTTLGLAVLLLAGCAGEEPGPAGDVSSDYDMPLARGDIRLSSISLNQGIEVTVVEDGKRVNGGDRTVPIIEGRTGMYRVYWTLPSDWEPREITARLTIHPPDAEPLFDEETKFIDEDSSPKWVESAFYWIVPGELMHPGTQFEVALFEADEELATGPLFEPVPYQAPTELGPSEGPRTMDVLVVPFDHQIEDGKGCDGPPEFDEVRRERWQGHLRAFNPVEDGGVTFEVREPVVWDQPMKEFGLLLAELRIIREQDDAPPWRYYFGALDPCDGGSEDNWAGLGSRPMETTKEQATRRVSVGQVSQNVLGTMETFVHEIGHNQERTHVLCAGNEGNPDETYPYEDGATGNYGFDIVNYVLEPPTVAEYMTYCGPTWVSDHGWKQVLPVIETLSQWEAEAAGADESGPEVVLGIITPSGAERWWTSRGDIVLSEVDTELEVWTDTELLEVVPAQTTELEDGSVEIMAAMPDRFADMTELRWPSQLETIPASIITDVSPRRFGRPSGLRAR